MVGSELLRKKTHKASGPNLTVSVLLKVPLPGAQRWTAQEQGSNGHGPGTPERADAKKHRTFAS